MVHLTELYSLASLCVTWLMTTLMTLQMSSFSLGRRQSQESGRNSALMPRAASSYFKCPPCSRLYCSPRRASKLKCRGGVTRGICGCCPMCAKVAGERCGGVWNYLGRCDAGLYCEGSSKLLTPSRGMANVVSLRSSTMDRGTPEGRCRKRSYAVADQGVPSYCAPPCTPDYCRKNAKAVCAALDLAEKQQSCQGQCQHTSCRACYFVKERNCGKCRKDDFECLKAFGRCVKRQYCSRNKFPCKDRKAMERGKFRCAVPDCV